MADAIVQCRQSRIWRLKLSLIAASLHASWDFADR